MNPSYICPVCRRDFLRATTLQRHMAHVHSNPVIVPITASSSSPSSRLLSSSSSSSTLHRCTSCQKIFSRYDNLQRHIQEVHTQTTRYVCDICDRQFKRAQHLTAHMMTHRDHHSVPSSSSSSSGQSYSPWLSALSSSSLVTSSTPTPSSPLLPAMRQPEPSVTELSPITPKLRLGSIEGEDRMLAYLPANLREIYDRYWSSIRTHLRKGRYLTTLTVSWNPVSMSPQWDDILLDLFHSQSSRFKINYSHSFILQDKESEELSFFHASLNNHTVLPYPLLISSKPDFLSFLRSLNNADILDSVQRQRPSSRYSVVAIPSTSFYIYHLTEFPIGCHLDELPSFIRTSKYLYTLQRSAMDGRPYRDNLCFFRCLALHRGATLKALQPPTLDVYTQWLMHCGAESTTVFSGVFMRDLERLEMLFSVNIDVFEYDCLSTASPVLVPSRRSEYIYNDTLRLLRYNNHFMYVVDINKLGHALCCPRCHKLWRTEHSLQKHLRSCGEVSQTVRYQGGVYSPTPTILDELCSYGISVDRNYIYPYRATYDFEVFFDTSQIPPPSQSTTYLATHVPLSVSVASNVDGFSEPVCFVSKGDPSELVGRMIDYLHVISRKASDILHRNFSGVFEMLESFAQRQREAQGERRDHENIPVNRLTSRLHTYLNELPVVGFNSSRYDLNVIKPHLLRCLHPAEMSGDITSGVEDTRTEEEEDVEEVESDDTECNGEDSGRERQLFIVKRNNQYLCISTGQLRFLDILNYLAPGFSYSKYLKAYDVGETKGFFPYEYIDSLQRLDETCLPSHNAFFSRLKNCNISVEEYQYCQDLWARHDMRTMRDFLTYYNNKDVGPFLTALDKQIEVYRRLGVDLLKDGISAQQPTVCQVD